MASPYSCGQFPFHSFKQDHQRAPNRSRNEQYPRVYLWFIAVEVLNYGCHHLGTFPLARSLYFPGPREGRETDATKKTLDFIKSSAS